MSKVTQLHPYDRLPGVALFEGVPVHKNVMAQSSVKHEIPIPWYRRWPWQPKFRIEIRLEPAVIAMDTPDFGKRIMIHPDLWDDMKAHFDS